MTPKTLRASRGRARRCLGWRRGRVGLRERQGRRRSTTASRPTRRSFDAGQRRQRALRRRRRRRRRRSTIPEAGPPVVPRRAQAVRRDVHVPVRRRDQRRAARRLPRRRLDQGAPMTHSGSVWTATVNVPWNQPVEYKFFVNGTTWETNPTQPMTTDDAGDMNNLAAPITCPNDYTCSAPPVPPAGVFDWRDAVIYFVFVDRFLDGDSDQQLQRHAARRRPPVHVDQLPGRRLGGRDAEDQRAGTSPTSASTRSGSRCPSKNADNVIGAGVNCDSNGNCSADQYEYSAYHGYWPTATRRTRRAVLRHPAGPARPRHGRAREEPQGALRLRDGHVHTSSRVYTQHVNDSPSWFTPFCQCGDTNNGCGNYNDYKLLVRAVPRALRLHELRGGADLLRQRRARPHPDVRQRRLPPRRHQAGRPELARFAAPADRRRTSRRSPTADPPQHFYMVGETYDFENTGLHRELHRPVDGARRAVRLPAALSASSRPCSLRSTAARCCTPADPDNDPWACTAPPGMQGLAQFMD